MERGRLALEKKRVIERSIDHAGQSFQMSYGIEVDEGSGTYKYCTAGTFQGFGDGVVDIPRDSMCVLFPLQHQNTYGICSAKVEGVARVALSTSICAVDPTIIRDEAGRYL